MRLLGLKEHQIPAWVLQELDKCEGARRREDPGERRAPALPKPFDQGEESNGSPEPFNGELLPDGHTAGRGHFAIEPQPYLELEERAEPLARKLIEEPSLDGIASEPEPADRGGRLSVRQYLRDTDHPFLVREEEPETPPAPAVRAVVDHSTSIRHLTSPFFNSLS